MTTKLPDTVPPPDGTDGLPFAKVFDADSIKLTLLEVSSYNLGDVDCPEVTGEPVPVTVEDILNL